VYVCVVQEWLGTAIRERIAARKKVLGSDSRLWFSTQVTQLYMHIPHTHTHIYIHTRMSHYFIAHEKYDIIMLYNTHI
jgi:hypothetical protein